MRISATALLTLLGFVSRRVGGQDAACYTSLSTLDEDERAVTDIEIVRTYILCPETTFFTGFVTTNGDILGGDKPLAPRKNMRVLCGEDGSSANNCVITRGSFGLTSIPANFDPPTVNTGVVVQGVTFDNLATYSLLVAVAGEFQFVDCIIRNNVAENAPVFIEWEGGAVGGGNVTAAQRDGNTRRLSSSEEPRGRYSYTILEKYRQNTEPRSRSLQATELKVDFINCVFLDNRSAPDSRLSLLVATGDGTNVLIANSQFDNNNYAVTGVNDAELYGVIVENFGIGPLEIESSCFVNNSAYGNALVTTYGLQMGTFTNNFGEGNNVTWLTELECTFAALVDSADPSFPNVDCSEFDASTCSRNSSTPPATNPPDTTVPPTSAVPLSPTSSPTLVDEGETEPPAPTVAPGPCYSSLTTIDEDERTVTDLEVVRTYILCPNTTFLTGFLTNNGDILGGDKPLTLRTNMHVLCGNDGKRSNNCKITQGSYGLTAIPANFDNPIENTGVIVQGVVFENLAVYGLLIGFAGSFQFIDCAITGHVAEQAPALIEWEGGSVNVGGNNVTTGNQTAEARDGDTRRLQSSKTTPPGRYSYTPSVTNSHLSGVENRELQVSTTLAVEFVDCLISDNKSAANSRLGTVILTGDGIDVKFTRCIFDNNDNDVPGVNDANLYGVVVEHFGLGFLTMDSTCFINNKAHANALVTEYRPELGTYTNNFGEGNSVTWLVELTCMFAALVDPTQDDFPNVNCTEFDASTCAIEVTEPSVTEPTLAPSSTGTISPVAPKTPTTAPEPTSTTSPPTTMIPQAEAPMSGATKLPLVSVSALMSVSILVFCAYR